VQPVRRRFSGRSRRCVGRLAARSVITAAALAGPLSLSSWADSTETARHEIRKALENWRSAFNGRDQKRLCDLFAPDLIANYQGQPQRDYASLCQLLQTSLQDMQSTYHYSLALNEILVYGETAIVKLVWTLEIDSADKPKEVIEEPAIDIFRHQADGSWKISRYLAYPTSSPPAAPAR
jgi:ketosteroid isomerase-like protein